MSRSPRILSNLVAVPVLVLEDGRSEDVRILDRERNALQRYMFRRRWYERDPRLPTIRAHAPPPAPGDPLELDLDNPGNDGPPTRERWAWERTRTSGTETTRLDVDLVTDKLTRIESTPCGSETTSL
jgi:hypothetical protein